MNLKNKKSIIIAAVIIGFLALCSGYALSTPVDASNTETNNTGTIQVTGEAVITSKPDQSIVVLAVETENTNAAAAVQENAKLADQVIASLKKAGVKADQIKTGSYYLYSFTDHPKLDSTREPITRYRATNSITLTLSNIDTVGKIIDTAINAGANNVQSVRFELKNSEAAKLQALESATKQAKAKADAVAKGAEVKITGIKSITEEGASYTPYRATFEMDMTKEAAVSTPIVPGDVEVHARVIVQYSF